MQSDHLFKPVSPKDFLGEELFREGLKFLQERTSGDFHVDIGDYPSVDSRAIGVIVNLTNRYKKQNRQVLLKNVGEKVLDVFQAMNLIQFLKIERAEKAPLPRVSASLHNLKVDYEMHDNIGIFKFTGSMDRSNDSAMFFNIINRIITDGHRMLIDMRELEFIDSLGVGVLVRLFNLIREGRTEVRFFGASEQVRKILEINGLGEVIKIYPTKEMAVEDWN